MKCYELGAMAVLIVFGTILFANYVAESFRDRPHTSIIYIKYLDSDDQPPVEDTITCRKKKHHR